MRKKNKTWFSFLATGQILLMANIVQNIVIEHSSGLGWIKFSGILILIPVIILWSLPFFTLRKFGEISSDGSFLATTLLVEKGIYKLIRHPQYLSFMLLNAAFALINQDYITILISIFSIGFLVAGLKEEDHNLIDQFGEEYADYKKRVPSINIFQKSNRENTQCGKTH